MTAERQPPTGRDDAALTAVLRAALTAVNQQFTHVLTLRRRGDSALADRITEVDDADFPAAMRIIDHLAARGATPAPGSDSFVPGVSRAEILAAEQAVETRFAAAIARTHCDSTEARALVHEAAAPRAAYADWLAEQTAGMDAAPREAGGRPVDRVFATLVAISEQAMIHAFLHWHRGDAALADAAWAGSGAAMMQGAALTRALADLDDAPAPGAIPAPQVSHDPATSLEFDRALVLCAAEQADTAAEAQDDGPLRRACALTAERARAIARWQPGTPHPAMASNPKGLTSFAATLGRYVRGAEPMAAR